MSNTQLSEGGVVKTQNDTLPLETEYYFDIVNTHSITLQNQITDNWVENNSAVHDHIAQSPLTITLSGMRGELVYKYDEAEAERLLQASRVYALKYSNSINGGFWGGLTNGYWGNETLNNVSDKLSTISSIIPSSSNVTQMAKNLYDYSMASFNRYKSIFDRMFGRNSSEQQSLLSNIQEPDNTKLKEIYNNFYAIRLNNQPMTVLTPYGEFHDMYIQSLTLRQDGQNYITDIELTLKQLRFANVETTETDKNVMAKYNAYARQQVENGGIAGTNSIIYNRITPRIGYNNHK